MATLWSPDTCDCQVEYDLDEGSEGNLEDFRNIKAVKTCKLHAELVGDELMRRVLDRNRSKNYVHIELVTQGAPEGELYVRYDPPDGAMLVATGHGFDADKIATVMPILAEKFPGQRIKVA